MKKIAAIVIGLQVSFCSIQLFAKSAVERCADYLSITTAISAKNFKSLNHAYQQIKDTELKNVVIEESINQSRYHLTLTGFNIEVNPALTKKQKNNVYGSVKSALAQSSYESLHDALDGKQKENAIVLPFAYIGVFKKKIVGIFELTMPLQNVINHIESRFVGRMQHLIDDGTVLAITKHQETIQPHISLAKIKEADAFGVGCVAPVPVTPLRISKSKAIISVQWRCKE